MISNKLSNSRNTSSTFGKKWSLASRNDFNKGIDPKLQHFVSAINRELDEFKHPDRIVLTKNKIYKHNGRNK